jgi:hypothetical protein
MSHTLMRAALAVALVASALVGATSAPAAEWLTNGTASGTTFGATAGASKLAVTPVGGAVQGLTCTSSTFDGAATGPTLTGTTAVVAHLTPAFGGTCQVVGQTSAVRCSRAPLTAQTFSEATALTGLALSSIHCVMVKTSGACGNATTFTGGGITIAGSVQGTYGNTSQLFTVSTAGQNLTVSWSSTGCLQGTGTGTASGSFSNATGTDLIYSSTSTFRPTFTFGTLSGGPQWTTNGPGSFSAAAPPTRIAVSPVGGPGPQNIVCTQSRVDGSLLGPTLSGSTVHIADLTPVLFGTCDAIGDGAAVKCGAAPMTAQSYTGTGGVTSGTVTAIDCVVAKTDGSCGNPTTFTGGGITVTGSVADTYGNTTQALTLSAVGQSLQASWSSTGCLAGTGTGSATSAWTNTTGTALVYGSTSTFRPRIAFTP